MKVFEICDDEYWFGETLEAVFAAALEETGITREEYEAEFTPHELTDAEMDAPNQVRIEPDGEAPELGSYRDALELATADGTAAGVLCARE